MTGGRQCNGVIMFGINRKMSADGKAERINELEKMNASYKKQIIKLENDAKQISELAIMIKKLKDRSKTQGREIATLVQRMKEIEEEHGRMKKQHSAEINVLARRYKELKRQARALERKMDREFVKKKKPRPSLMGRILAIRDRILDLIG